MSDQRAADGLGEIAVDMRITAAPRHPGSDPVSTGFVERLVGALRGDDGFAPRLTEIIKRLEASAALLAASRQRHQATDEEAATRFNNILDGERP